MGRMKTRGIVGIALLVGAVGWWLFGTTWVTDARVAALVEKYGPLVEAETGRPLAEGLRTEVLTKEELYAHFEALNIASGAYVPEPAHTEVRDDGRTAHIVASTDWDAVRDAAQTVAHFDPRDDTIRVCSSNVDAVAAKAGLNSVAFLEVVLLHELVHAADGTVHGAQWIEDAALDGDAARAARLLVEGHATLVARRLAERLDLAATEQRWEQHLAESWGWAADYLRSAEYLERLEREGGRSAVDDALAAPPASIDDVLYPELGDAARLAPSDGSWLTEALYALAESHGDVEALRLRTVPRHECEGRLYVPDSSDGRAVACALTEQLEIVGVPVAGQRDDEVALARANVFASEEAAEEYLRAVEASADARHVAESIRHAEFFDSLEEQVLTRTALHGDAWAGVLLSRRWEFSSLTGSMLEGHTLRNGEIEIRHAHARRGRVVLELFPVHGDGGPLTPTPRFDAAFALIADAR